MSGSRFFSYDGTPAIRTDNGEQGVGKGRKEVERQLRLRVALKAPHGEGRGGQACQADR